MQTIESDIIELAQGLLSHRYGGTQQLAEVKKLSGSGTTVVLRARLASQPFLQQRSVIVKFVPETGDIFDDAALLREIAAYQFTTSLSEDVRPGPVLLAHDMNTRIIVLSDSGDGDTFADLLTQREPELRQQILRNLGTALGRMHAGTAGLEDNFRILLTRLLKNHPELQSSRDLRDRSVGPATFMGVSLIENSGITVPDVVKEIADEATARLAHGRSRAFTPFDLSPDNIIVAERTQFLDYEWAGFRDVSYDLACVVGGFPQFVGVSIISDEEAEAFLKAWVEEVESIWPHFKNEDALHERITSALVSWALSSVAMLHHGSLSNALTTLDDPDDFEVTDGTRLLAPPHQGPFSDDELFMRRDFYETFYSLSRYARLGRDSRYQVVSAFADEIVARVAEPRY